MKVVKEEVAAQEDTQPKEAGMNKQEFMSYKKALKEKVEMLELEARLVKAQWEYYNYTAQMQKIYAAMAEIEKSAEEETPKPKMGIWTPQGEV